MANVPEAVVEAEPTVQAANRKAADAASRLKEAVRKAGGPAIVAQRSGVALSTLNAYIADRGGMKLDRLALIAAACGVSIDWIATGQEAAAAPAPPPPERAEEPRSVGIHLKLMRDGNRDRITRAFERADKLFRDNGKVWKWPDLVLVAMTMHDMDETLSRQEES